MISESFAGQLAPILGELNAALFENWEEWEVPIVADSKWPKNVKKTHARWIDSLSARQREIDASIAAKAEFEYLFDRPFEDNSKVTRRRPVHCGISLAAPSLGSR